MLVWMPPTSYSRRARIMRAMALLAVAAPDGQLGEQRVVFHGDGPAIVDAAIQANARAHAGGSAGSACRGREGSRCRDLRHRCGTRWPSRARTTSCCVSGSGRAGGDFDLEAHQVEAGHQFGDGMLHLQARVHLQEVEAPFGVHQEFHRAGVVVTGRAGGCAWPLRPWPRASPDATASSGDGHSSITF